MSFHDEELDEILAGTAGTGFTTYLDDPRLGFGHVSTERDEMGIPQFSPQAPKIPVALVERHREAWTRPDESRPQEMWTEHATQQGMSVLGSGVYRLPILPGWAIGKRTDHHPGLQLQQPDGNSFAYASCAVASDWVATARDYGGVIVLHGPRLGLHPEHHHLVSEREHAREIAAAKQEGLVTGGIMAWGRPA